MDWNRAYDNRAAVVGSDAFFTVWQQEAASFRARWTAADLARLDVPYGDHPRQRLDLFLPHGSQPKGLLVHVHGGYWMRTDKSFWSHFADGALANGFAVAVPSYRLCPEVSIASITADISAAITCAASLVAGCIVLSGHSAGGHLVSRQLCQNARLEPKIASRIRGAASISGLHDLRPLINTSMNESLQLSMPTARAESPALLEPRPDSRLFVWVGVDELPEFRRQAALMDIMWQHQLAHARAVELPGTHHFDIVNALHDPAGEMLTSLLASVD